MSELELYMDLQIKKLVPQYDGLDVRATVGDNSYSVEFFVTVDGEKMQCYDMVDAGILKEEQVDEVLSEIASAIRKAEDYEPGSTKKYLL